MRTRGWLIVGILTLAALLLVGRVVTSIIVDYEWYASMDLTTLWWERATSRVMLQGALAIVGTAFAFANFAAVLGTIRAVAVPQRLGNIELTEMVPSQRLVSVVFILSFVVGIALSAPMNDWELVTMARRGIPFGEIEGYHNRDLGFYVYWLPLEETLYVWTLVSIVVVTALVMIAYAITRSLRVEGRRVLASSHVRRHVAALGAMVLLLLAWSYRLDAFDLLRQGSGPDGLFMRVDHVVTLRVDAALTIICAIAAVLLLRAGWLGQGRAVLAIIGGILVLALGFRHGLPAMLSRGSTIGEPVRREADYQATRALVSRRAFDVDGIIHGSKDSSRGLERVPLDFVPHRTAAWPQAVAAGLSTAASRGAGTAVVGNPAITRTSRGTVGLLTVVRPTGTTGGWQVFLRDLAAQGQSAQELRWTGGADSARTMYSAITDEPLVAPGLSDHLVIADETGAIPGPRLESFISRFAHAWSARDPSVFRADTIGPAAVYVAHRDVRARVARVAPIFAQGREVLPLVHEGTLYWTIDLYSASPDYPLSDRWQLARDVYSYFRHAGTALVDATTGRMRIVRADRADAIARTWIEIAPTLFSDVVELPPSLVAMLPAPVDGVIAQLRSFARHGSRFEGIVQRHFTDSAFSPSRTTLLLASANEQLVPAWSIPLLDTGEQLGGVATAMGGALRGAVWDTTAVPRAAWSTITEQMRAALDSARARLPDGSRREPRVRFGAPLVFMSTEGPAVMQSVFGTDEGATPLLQVAVSLRNRIVTASDLSQAVLQLGGHSASIPLAPDRPLGTEPRDVMLQRLYDAMRDALRRSDWIRFGTAFDSLGRVLGRPPQ